jgi:F-type H+-transporting ATPase subunit b
MNLIDIRQVLTQIVGFLIMLWVLRRYAWGPLIGMLETRRQKIASEFQEAERRQAEADKLHAQYEQDLRGVEAKARQRIQEAVAEGQRVAAEIKENAHAEAAARLERAQEDIAREAEKAKEVLKQQMISLSLRSAEKILRQKLDDSAQRKLVGEFIDEVAALR